MKRSLIFSCAAFAAVAVAVLSIAEPRAEAFDIGRTYEVYIINGYQKVDTGKLISRTPRYVDDDEGHESCSYHAMWDGLLGVPSPAQLFFDERITPGYMDCEVNATISFPTIIVNSPDYENSGINKFQESKSILNMVLSENADGSASGIIVFDENHPYPLLLEPSNDTSPKSPGESTIVDR